MIKQCLRSSMLSGSQITQNGSRPHFACLEAAGQLLLRKLGRQEVKSASPTRQRRAS
jgi:hypothetical protein